MSSFYPTLNNVVDSNYEEAEAADTARQSRDRYERPILIQSTEDVWGR
jgi:hypothetical protein